MSETDFADHLEVEEKSAPATTGLDGSNRCDGDAKGACRAQVRLRSIESSSELELCGHHYQINQARLSEGFDVIIDQREDLVAKEDGLHA